MDLEQTVAALQLENEKLWQENEQWKLMLNVVKENVDLRARMQSFNNAPQEITGRKPSSLWQSTLDDREFIKHLKQTKFEHEHRTSSPVNFKSFIQSSMYTDTCEEAECQSCQAVIPPEVKVADRLLGEIAYQLDRRILSHVFQGHKRLYGFTVLNIPHKIIEVTTHPLTGKVDEGYRLHLTQRHADLMDQLNQLGYKIALHPPFTEFIVNTYGILKEKPDEHSTQARDYSDPDFLRKLILNTAPTKLQKHLLLVLTCLCNMAEKDKLPLLLW
uniref:Speriolin C-terminal domain-containing protein n=1 Tax=Monopterus albus TaxID=43700 RepID=A0A3Q3JPR6_MONAL|nr:speriolin-like protein [Monopterus albus]